MKVIICEYNSWDYVVRIGSHHYARAFLDDGWDVLWLSHPVSTLHALKPENRERMRHARSGPVSHPDGPIEVIPHTYLPYLNLPFLSSRWALEHSEKFFRPRLEDLLADTGFLEPDLLWITDTTMHALADVARANAVAVRLADANIQFANAPPSLRWAEEKLCDRADVLFVTSSPLEEPLRGRYGNKLHLLRNGVDFEHFQGEVPVPEEYRDVEGPIAVYVGAIDDWFASDWVAELAQARGDITIALIGPPRISLAPLQTFPNVRILGPRLYADLPSYLVHAHCGIVPFRRTPLVESVSPLKLYEFLASGLPVVSTRWRELEHLGSPALLASNADEFVHLVGRVIDENWKTERDKFLRDYARENSWQSRYQSAMEALARFLD